MRLWQPVHFANRQKPSKMKEQVREASDEEPRGTAGLWGTEDGCERIRKVLTAKDISDILNFKPDRTGKRRSLKAPSSSLWCIKDRRIF